jgi:hypothetical protein
MRWALAGRDDEVARLREIIPAAGTQSVAEDRIGDIGQARRLSAGRSLVRLAAQLNRALPNQSPAARRPGGTANNPLPVCRMYSLSASFAASRCWIGTNCRRGSRW